jgi:hypothetical protein
MEGTAGIALALAVQVAGSADPAAAPRFKSLCEPVNRCTDRRGCPDFVVDQGILSGAFFWELTYAPDDCSVIEGEVNAGTREYVSFNTMISNFGPGAITLGDPLDHPEWFDLVTCHGHAHIKEYADYRLWTAAGYEQWTALRAANPEACVLDIFAAHPELEGQLARGHKQGFCLYDVVPHAQLSSVPCPAAQDPKTYPGCDFAGLGVCWSDIYEAFPGFIDGQAIDVQDLPDGEYVLENEVNARHFFREANYLNNSAAVRLRLFQRGQRRLMEILGPA